MRRPPDDARPQRRLLCTGSAATSNAPTISPASSTWAVQQMLERRHVDTDSMVRHVMAIPGFTPDDKRSRCGRWSTGRLRPRFHRVHRLASSRPPARTPAVPARSSPARCGNASTRPTWVSTGRAPSPTVGPARVLAHVKRARRDVRRPHRCDAEPRRRVQLPDRRTFYRARGR